MIARGRGATRRRGLGRSLRLYCQSLIDDAAPTRPPRMRLWEASRIRAGRVWRSLTEPLVRVNIRDQYQGVLGALVSDGERSRDDFGRAKRARDRFLHGLSVAEDALNADEVRRLVRELLDPHVGSSAEGLSGADTPRR